MPNYHYACEACGYEFEIRQSIKDEALTTCVECKQEKIHRVIHAVSVLTKDEPVTVIQQADRNEKRMGRCELEERRHEVKESGRKGREAAGNVPKPTRPWWRDTDKIDTELAKLAPHTVVENRKLVKSDPLSKEAMDYIMTGKKPS